MPRAQVVSAQVAGLATNPNPLTAPEGTFTVLENCVANRPGVVENRRGWNLYAATSAAPSALGEYKNTLLVHDGTGLKRDDGAGSLTAYTGSFTAVTGHRMRFLEERKNLYFPTSTGIKRLDGIAGTPAAAGCGKGLDLAISLSVATGVVLPASEFMGLRLTWVKKDSNGRVLESYPTPLYVVENTEVDARNLTILSSIPDDMATGDYYRLYATDAAATASAVGDTCYQVKEGTITSGDSGSGYVTVEYNSAFIDETPLYTNPEEQTIDQGNDIPPYARDLASFKGYTLYAATKQPQEIQIQLTDVDALANTDTITIGGEVYTFSGAENPALGEFLLVTAGDEADDIEATMQSLAKVINRDSALFYANYIYAEDEMPGKVHIWARDVATAAFAITANDTTTGGCFTPVIPASGTTVQSAQDDNPNRLYWSRLDQPDAVPYTNYEDIGSEDHAILRVLPLQSSVVIVKEVGIYLMTGDSPATWSFKPLDPKIRCFAPDSWGVLNNQAVGLSDQGIVRADENGVAIISFDVDSDIRKIFSYSNFGTVTHATCYQSERLYILWCQEASADTYAKLGYVYNFLVGGGQWSGPWRKNIKCSHILRTDDKLYVGKGDESYVLKERKSYTTSSSDYSDESIAITITGVGTTTDADGNTVSTATFTTAYALATMAAGWALTQGSDSATIESLTIVAGTHTATLSEEIPGLATGAAYAEMPITSILRWRPEACNNPHVKKDFTKCHIAFEDDAALHHQVSWHHNIGFSSDHLSDISYYAKTMDADGGWGMGEYGETPLGDEDPSVMPRYTADVPTKYRVSNALSVFYKHATAREHFSILSMALEFRQLGGPGRRKPR
jgi:hypothetical protein